MERIRPSIALVLVPFLTGCAAFDWEEAEDVAKANTLFGIIAFDALTSDLAAQSSRSTDATATFDEIEGGFEFSGTITSDGPYWTGTMGFDGSLVGDANSAEWTFGADFDQCADGTNTLDGSMDWRWEAEIDATSAHFEWEVEGELTATGEIEGTGEVDYLAQVDLTGTSASYAVEGNVGGTPVDFSLTVNVPFAR